MEKEIDLKELSKTENFRELLGVIKKGDTQYILKDNGLSQAALLSLEDLELLKQAKADQKKAWQDILNNLKEVHSLSSDFSLQEVEDDVDQAVREVRKNRNKA